ncbi:LemA family protein [bacterium]|jgi:LemA protein|nr:LemA family protein [bacterium]
MNKSKWVLPGIGVAVLLFIGWTVSVSNSMVRLDEGVNGAKAQVENVYQRRLDLIPNLVNTVRAYAKHEAEVLEGVAKARSQAGQVNITAKPEDFAKYDQAQVGLSHALSRLLVVAEKYPDLKADRNFQELQSQLEGSENRITIERQRFNEASQTYNVYVRSFPQMLIAMIRGFKERPYFSAAAGAATAPEVKF